MASFLRTFHLHPSFALVIILVFFSIGIMTAFGLTNTANVTGSSPSLKNSPDISLFYSQPLNAGGLINATRALDFSQRAMTPKQAAELAVRTMQNGQEIVIICGQVEEGIGRSRCFIAKDVPTSRSLKNALTELAERENLK